MAKSLHQTYNLNTPIWAGLIAGGNAMLKTKLHNTRLLNELWDYLSV